MKRIWTVMAAGTILSFAQPLMADVKTGVDAWQQGDYGKAVAEWLPLAQTGDADAQFNMGQAYKLGRGVKTNMAAAMDWYRKASAQGHKRAEDNLGLLMFQQGDRAGAMPYLQRSAMRGEPRAQYIVGTALFNGDLANKDWVRAYAFMTRASASGLAQASASIKEMDKYIPADQREQGLAMANDFGQQEKTILAGDTEPFRGQQVIGDPPARLKKPDPVITKKPVEPRAVAAEKPAPSKAVAAKPTLPSASGGDWRVQLGAFSEEGRARALWNQLSGKVKGLSAYKPFIIKGGAVTRLQAGPLASSADAARLCGAIKAAGADCMPKKM